MTDNTEKLKLSEHLEELRGTLLRALIGVVAGVVIAVFFTSPLITWLALPIGGLEKLVSIEVTETVSVFMRVALVAGVILSAPWVFYQGFRFISKGMTASEKKWVYIGVPFATLMFLGGVVFAYFIMLPASMQFFSEFLDVTTTIRIKSYFNFLTNLVFWIGVSFELPLLAFILARIGLITSKQMVKGWRAAIVVIAVLAAVITPTGDPVNMMIFMVPLTGLYLLSIGLAAVAGKSRAKANAVQPEEK